MFLQYGFLIAEGFQTAAADVQYNICNNKGKLNLLFFSL